MFPDRTSDDKCYLSKRLGRAWYIRGITVLRACLAGSYMAARTLRVRVRVRVRLLPQEAGLLHVANALMVVYF